MRLLLFGGNGQLGWELRRALAPLADVTALSRENGGDLVRPRELVSAIRRAQPHAIVNAAAYTAVDQAECERELVYAVNAEAPAILAREAKRVGAWLVHYSTDYVFDGSGERPWREDDPTRPLNVYGQSKLEGETAVKDSACYSLVFRTSWVYAAHGQNFIRTMLRLCAERDAMQVINDQHGAPTGAALIADVTSQALPAAMRHPGRAGLYHVAAADETTWHGYASWVIQQARAAGWPVRVTDDAIARVSSEGFGAKATRPHNSRLACDRLAHTFGLRMPPWQQGVHHALTEILSCKRCNC